MQTVLKADQVEVKPALGRLIDHTDDHSVCLYEQVVHGFRRHVSVFSIVVNAEFPDITSDRLAFEVFGQLRAIREREDLKPKEGRG